MLDAAWDLIVERGADVSLAEIATAVAMTRQSIYVHFGSRGGLLVALVRRADERARIFEAFASALALSDPAERLDRCLEVWLAFVVDIHPVANDLIRLRSHDSDAANAWADRMTDLRRLFATLTASLADDGALDPFWDADTAADAIWAGASVQMWSLLVLEQGWSHADASATIRRTMARSVLV